MSVLTQDAPLQNRNILLGFSEEQDPIIHDFTQNDLMLIAPNGSGRFMFASAIMFDVLTKHFEYYQVNVITDSETFIGMCPYANRFTCLHRYDSENKVKRAATRQLLVIDHDYVTDHHATPVPANTDVLLISKSPKSRENGFAMCERVEGKKPLYSYGRQTFPLILPDSFDKLFSGNFSWMI